MMYTQVEISFTRYGLQVTGCMEVSDWTDRIASITQCSGPFRLLLGKGTAGQLAELLLSLKGISMGDISKMLMCHFGLDILLLQVARTDNEVARQQRVVTGYYSAPMAVRCFSILGKAVCEWSSNVSHADHVSSWTSELRGKPEVGFEDLTIIRSRDSLARSKR